ncbi:MAG: SRPBCC domain-containing protein [Pseudomonadota bacterium]
MTDVLADIVETIEIDAPVQKVWRAMTSEVTVPNWLGCMRYRAEVGAIFYMQQDQQKSAADDISGATHCEILALDEPKLFRFSWFVPGFPKTFVQFELAALTPSRTRVSFTHEGWGQFPPDAVRQIWEALSGGWKSFVLPNLKREVERG